MERSRSCGVRRRIDDQSYSIRFTPRKSRSTWSAINIGRVAELAKLGLMHAAGVRALEQRTEDKSRIYACENAPRTLPPAYEQRLHRNRKAWRYWRDQPPSCGRVAIYWVVSAKKEETRARRLALLIDDSAKGRRLAQYTLQPRPRDER